jgi:desulfoferrodoxin (superoxide reductase-like protein)
LGRYLKIAKGVLKMGKIRFCKVVSLAVFIWAMFLLLPAPGFADKSSVTIEVSEKAEKESKITIQVNVRHSANNLFHYTNWVSVSVNGKEVKRWEFSSLNRPEEENFSREIQYRVNGPLEIVAEANCNMHGSAGPKEKTVHVK